MVALNFKAQFAGPVERREKRQTVRSKARCRAGDKIQLYTGMRTKSCRKLVAEDATCKDVTYIAVRPRNQGGLTLGDTSRFPRDIDEFARADGFDNYDEMHAFFAKQYGTEYYTGYVIRWHWPEA